MIRRLGFAALVAGTALAGVATGTATAEPAPACADYHWIGAAGSGQRTGASLMANSGMGDVVYQSYEQLRSDLAADGRTISAEAVDYPAAPVPTEGGLGGWLGFMDSVKAGENAALAQFDAYTQQCPNSKVVLAGYSQGAMVIHRLLHDVSGNPAVAAALLVADGDRLPGDTTIDMGSAAAVPGPGKGVAQEHFIVASTDTSPLPPEVGARTVSVCDLGDPVCDYNPDTTQMSPAEFAIHTGYAPTSSGAHAWTAPLYRLAASAPSVTAPVTDGPAATPEPAPAN